MRNKLSRFCKKDVEVKSIERKYDGFFKINQYQIAHKLFNGGMSSVFSREIFERGDAVVLIPYDPIKDRLVFNQQFRPGALRTQEEPWLLEFVAGMFGENESPVDVAIREAKEEANLTVAVEDILPVMNYLSSPGGTSEQMHVYIAKVDSENVEGVYGLESENEDIQVLTLARSEALTLLKEGKINNAATIIGLQWLQIHLEDIRTKWV